MRLLIAVLALASAAAAFAEDTSGLEDEADAGMPGTRVPQPGDAPPVAAAKPAPPDAGMHPTVGSPTAEQRKQMQVEKVTRGIDVKSEMQQAPSKPPLDVSRMTFSHDNLVKVVAYNEDEVQSCYEQVLASLEKPIEGVLMTAFYISPEGNVKRPRIERKGTTIKNAKLNACVLQVLGHMVFPKPPGDKDTLINYPFNLKAVH